MQSRRQQPRRERAAGRGLSLALSRAYKVPQPASLPLRAHLISPKSEGEPLTPEALPKSGRKAVAMHLARWNSSDQYKSFSEPREPES